MNYCDYCQRHLNGAYNCPGCGAGVAHHGAVARLEHALASQGQTKHEMDSATVTLSPVFGTAPDDRRNRKSPPLMPAIIGLTTLVACVAIAVLISLGNGNNSPTTVEPTSAGRRLEVLGPSASARTSSEAAGHTSSPQPTDGRSSSGTAPQVSSSQAVQFPVGGNESQAPGTAQPSAGSQPPAESQSPDITPHPDFPDSFVGQTDRCLASGEKTSNGGESLVMASCDGSASQSWLRTPDGSVRNNTSDRCIDIIDAQIDSGSAVQLFVCNGTPAQTWAYSSSHELINPQSGRCLDTDALTIEDCDGSVSQKWRLT
ncbi:ricin-type beta-trefoil lectin domain protein [Streptomyces sp. NPDC088354]|uniref:ricin-type beta-trefoil lectin domain protein n=1 Tax=Streptomyces sp. NPDC088354 TaxID=3365856 RepID=UPI0037F2B3D6